MGIVDGLLDLLEILATNKTKGKPNQLELLKVIINLSVYFRHAEF